MSYLNTFLNSVSRIGKLACILLPITTAIFADNEPSNAKANEILLVIGAAGESSFATGFAEAAEQWEAASSKADAQLTTIGLDESDTSDRERIQQYLEAAEKSSDTPLWIVYVGHGTYSARENLVNLRGPDLNLSTIAEWLSPFERPLIFIHGGSASAPIISELSGNDRIIISATRSSQEINYTRFGEYFARSLSLNSADLNQDEQVSVLEAYLFASDLTQKFYEENARLASEHSLIDDNGDKAGTPYDWFMGTRVVKRSTDNRLPDGFRAHQISLIPSEQESKLNAEQRAHRDQLELQLETLRRAKDQHTEEVYYQKVEAILEKLSDIYIGKTAETQVSADASSPSGDT